MNIVGAGLLNMSTRLARITWLLALVALLVGACGGDDDGGAPGTGGVSGGAPIAFEGSAELLKGFSFDTGLVPAGSPVAASFKLAAGGKAVVKATAEIDAGRVVGKKGGGEVALDVRFTMAGRLKIDSPLKKIDEELPGLSNIDVPIAGKVGFDPFLVDDGEAASVEAAIPETKLPPIPLGSVPGKLELTVTKESKLRTSFRGDCLSVAGGNAHYRGRLTTAGTLVLSGRIVVELPPPLNTPVDLGVITVDIPASTSSLDLGTRPAPGADDARNGSTCEAESDGDDNGGDNGHGSDNDNDSDAGSKDGGSGPTGDAGVTTRTYVGTLAKTGPVVFGGGSGNCTYDVVLENVAVTLLVQGSQVINGSVSDQSVERVLGSCPYPAAGRGQQTFTLFAPTAVGAKLSLVGASSNKPRANITADLAPSGNGYEATLRWQRTDIGPPFDWSVTAKVVLVAQ